MTRIIDLFVVVVYLAFRPASASGFSPTPDFRGKLLLAKRSVPSWAMGMSMLAMSAYEYFERRFGRPARTHASIAFSLAHFSKMGFVLYLIALTLPLALELRDG